MWNLQSTKAAKTQQVGGLTRIILWKVVKKNNTTAYNLLIVLSPTGRGKEARVTFKSLVWEFTVNYNSNGHWQNSYCSADIAQHQNHIQYTWQYN